MAWIDTVTNIVRTHCTSCVQCFVKFVLEYIINESLLHVVSDEFRSRAHLLLVVTVIVLNWSNDCGDHVL